MGRRRIVDAFEQNKQSLVAEGRRRKLSVSVLVVVLASGWVSFPLLFGMRDFSVASMVEQGVSLGLFGYALYVLLTPSVRLSGAQVSAFVVLLALTPFISTTSWNASNPGDVSAWHCAGAIGGSGFLACLAAYFIVGKSTRRFGWGTLITASLCVLAMGAGIGAECYVSSAVHLSGHCLGIIVSIALVFLISKQEADWGD